MANWAVSVRIVCRGDVPRPMAASGLDRSLVAPGWLAFLLTDAVKCTGHRYDLQSGATQSRSGKTRMDGGNRIRKRLSGLVSHSVTPHFFL
jgi:hypothetical protein